MASPCRVAKRRWERGFGRKIPIRLPGLGLFTPGEALNIALSASLAGPKGLLSPRHLLSCPFLASRRVC